MPGTDSPARAPAPDPEALDWLDRWHAKDTPEGGVDRRSDETDMYTRAVVLDAFVTGRTAGEASSVVDVSESGLGLLREAAALFREYERHHTAKAEAILCADYPVGEERQAATDAAFQAASDTTQKAEHNAAIASRIEEFIARPGPSLESFKLAHGLLSEPLSWLHNSRLLPTECLGRNLAEIANALIAAAYPDLAAVMPAGFRLPAKPYEGRGRREDLINTELAALPDPPMVGVVAEIVQRHAPGWAFQFDQNVANTGGNVAVRLTIYDQDSPL